MPETPDEELVRRLLADARHDTPVPADVVTRLDGVLEELAAERAEARTSPPEGRSAARVAPLDRDRGVARRRWASVLVAAAAIVVAGVAVRSAWPEGSGSAGSTASSDSALESGGRSSAGDKSAVSGEVALLSRGTLAADVRRTVSRLRAPVASLTATPAPESFTCEPADWGPGTAVPARLDGTDAMLLLRPPTGGRQVADVLECGTARMLASAVVPVR